MLERSDVKSVHHVRRRKGYVYDPENTVTHSEARGWEHRDMRLCLCKRYWGITYHQRKQESSDVPGCIRGELNLKGQKIHERW